MASSFGWNSGCLRAASASTRRRIAPAMNAPRMASNPRCVARAPRPTTSSIDSRMRIWAEVSASLFNIPVIHIERSMRSVAITTRTTKTPSSDSSSSLGPRAVARPEKKSESRSTELTSPSEAPAIASWPTGRSATPASFRIGMIIPSDVAMRMIPMSSVLSTTPAACSAPLMPSASTALRPNPNPARRARGPRKWRTSISRPAMKSRNASPIVATSRTAWSGFTRSSTAGPSTIPATISSTGPGIGTCGTAARIKGTAAATASTATRLSKFIAGTLRAASRPHLCHEVEERAGDVYELVGHPARDDQHVAYTEGVPILARHHGGAALDGLHDVCLAVVQLHLTGPGAAPGIEFVAGRLEQQTASLELRVHLVLGDVRRRVFHRQRLGAEYSKLLILVRGR